MNTEGFFCAWMMKTFSLKRRIALVTATFVIGLLMLELHTVSALRFGHRYMEYSSDEVMFEGNKNAVSAPHRKLLNRAPELEPNRAWGESKCSKSDIVINQGQTTPLPSGIPTYTVEIMNVCVSGCDISAIHLSCGWFSSARLINPRIFKRLRFNDCVVNDGKPLNNGQSISFAYANTFSYPLSVSSVVC